MRDWPAATKALWLEGRSAVMGRSLVTISKFARRPRGDAALRRRLPGARRARTRRAAPAVARDERRAPTLLFAASGGLAKYPRSSKTASAYDTARCLDAPWVASSNVGAIEQPAYSSKPYNGRHPDGSRTTHPRFDGHSLAAGFGWGLGPCGRPDFNNARAAHDSSPRLLASESRTGSGNLGADAASLGHRRPGTDRRAYRPALARSGVASYKRSRH